MKKISEHISSYEPEVSLAINTAPSTEEELEDFFFEHGFEYIDGHNTEKRASTVGSPDSSGALRLKAICINVVNRNGMKILLESTVQLTH